MSAKEVEVYYLLNGSDRVLVLGQSHRPARDDGSGIHRDVRRMANLLAR